MGEGQKLLDTNKEIEKANNFTIFIYVRATENCTLEMAPATC